MAFLAAAPEAEAAAGAAATKARAVAGKVKGKGKSAGKGAGRNITSDMSPEEVRAELARRKQEAAAPKGDDQAPADQPAPSSSKPAAPLFTAQPADKWHTGSGLVLGAVGWVLFMNFMQGGMPQVRRWGAAKFLNHTPQVGGTK